MNETNAKDQCQDLEDSAKERRVPFIGWSRQVGHEGWCPSDDDLILVEGQGLFVVLWNVLAVVWKPRERLERVVNHDY